MSRIPFYRGCAPALRRLVKNAAPRPRHETDSAALHLVPFHSIGDCHGLAHLGSDPKSGRGTPPFPRRTPIRSRPCTLPKLPSSPLYPSAGTRSARVRSPGPSASARIAARRSQCQSLSKAVRHLKPGRPMRLSHPHVGRNYTTPEIGNLQFDKHPPAGCLLQCMNVRTLD